MQIGESAVEFLNAVTIATPMKGLVGDDVLKGECNHRTFHGMKVVGGGGQKIAEIEVSRDEFNDIGRVAKIPGEPVETRIYMTGSASGLAKARGVVSVVKMRPTGFPHSSWCSSEKQ